MAKTFTPEQENVLIAAGRAGLLYLSSSGIYACRFARGEDISGVVLEFARSVLTPAQLAADQLQSCAERYLAQIETLPLHPLSDLHSLREELRALLGPLRPPAPPTLEEALDVLRQVRSTGVSTHAVDALLARVPK